LLSTPGFVRWGGLAFVLGNALFLVNKLNEMSRLFLGHPIPDVISGKNLGLILLGQAALIVGYLAIYKSCAPRVGRWGKVALRLFTGGGIVLAVGHVSFMSGLANYLPASILPIADNLFLLVLIGVLFLLIGLIWLGVLNLRQPILTGRPWLPLATGLMGFIGFVVLGGREITAIFLVFRTLFALGLMGLGLALWLGKPASPGAVSGRILDRVESLRNA
jgi:hypothetical protein